MNKTHSLYKQAYKQCDEYFESVKLPDETYRAKIISRDAAREAFNHKHGGIGSIGPCAFTDEDVDEYVALFKEFLSVYLKYSRGSEKGER